MSLLTVRPTPVSDSFSQLNKMTSTLTVAGLAPSLFLGGELLLVFL